MSGARELRLLGEGFTFLEGPRWHDGRLWLSDCPAGTVHTFHERDGWETICRVPGSPSGLGFSPDGELLIVSMRDRRLLRLRDGALEQFADLGALMPGEANDMVVDRAGRAYVGNFGSDIETEPLRPTRLVRVDPDGTATADGEELVFPNGSVITPDGRTLIVAESFAYRLSAFDVAADGSLSNRRIWAQLGDDPLPARVEESFTARAPIPDGIALDAEGAVWVADAKGSGIPRVAEGGEILDFVDTGELGVYAAALGGEDRRTLYLCASPPLGHPEAEQRAYLLACRVEVPGAGIP
ncbi:MAG: SMP-30/gluconolactonase/LRE family protein [Conexibacter sp.]